MMDRSPPFATHLSTAHHYWQLHLKPGDLAIDATCGNGKDTLALANLCNGSIYAIDIQKDAIISTQTLLQKELTPPLFDSIRFIQGCHSSFPAEIAPNSVSLIVYNLGYLPKGDKSFTTLSSTTLASLASACELLKIGGLISVTCYSGHPQGEPEEKEVLNFARHLDPKQWSCCHHQWLNRPKSPTLLLLEKIA